VDDVFVTAAFSTNFTRPQRSFVFLNVTGSMHLPLLAGSQSCRATNSIFQCHLAGAGGTVTAKRIV